MNSPTSLSSFFADPKEANLNNCDREQIHLSGMVQNIGALLVIDPVSEQVIGASENAAAFLGFDPEQLLLTPLADVNSALALQVREAQDETQILHDVLEFGLEHEGIFFDTVTHIHSGRRIIEFVPNLSPDASHVRTNMRNCSKASARIMHADTFEQALSIGTDAIRQISGFSRVKIYQFLPDWSGKVIAESSDGTFPSFLGLCFPATDIPKQSRAIMSIVPYRAIATTADDPLSIVIADGVDEPLDLTWSVLRSVSVMHTQYLRNIGVGATYTCSLMHQGKLWGLIAAHNDTPAMLPFDSWSLIHEIGTSVMLRYDQKQRSEKSDMITELRKIETLFSSTLRLNGDVEDVLQSLVPVLRTFLGADGFAFQYGSNLHVSGNTPPPDFIRTLIKWAIKQRKTSDQLQTTKLHEQWEPARAHIDTACGVLIQPIVVHRVCQLIWFRKPITQTVHWAGRPDTKEEGGPLTPRTSFDTWVQEHADESAPWLESQLESAREIFKEFLDIIAAQLLLKEENASLRNFAATAAHDLKAPLFGINKALEWMREDEFDETAVRENHAIAERSSKRLSQLTDGLLELAVIQDQPHNFGQVDLSQTASDVCDLLTAQIGGTSARIETHDLPTITGSPSLLLRLVLNLVSNAIKYRHPDRVPHIKITGRTLPTDEVEVSITDNGLGIAPEYAEKVFSPMTRLHGADQIEGSGLGLTICQQIMNIHGGSITLDTKREEGSCFVFTLPLEQTTQ